MLPLVIVIENCNGSIIFAGNDDLLRNVSSMIGRVKLLSSPREEIQEIMMLLFLLHWSLWSFSYQARLRVHFVFSAHKEDG
ncbi:hypothetical protein K1719_030952 [Acacia pycnantha]|nr:hypothetical protein K1719_030952 [Acacia pycnantha]